MHSLTIEQVAGIIGGTLLQGDAAAVVHGVTTDSRSVTTGQLFIPLHGERFDGHDFIAGALDGGAVAAVVAKGKVAALGATFAAAPGAGFVAVPDTLHALHELAMDARQRLGGVEGRVVAVTGSVGKTTTKDMLAAMLAVRWSTTKSAGNFNNEIGLPLTLLRADGSTEALVLEMGMRGLGEIRALARIARPDVAVITNVSEVHLERLRTVERIATAKRELVDELPQEGIAVLNGDDELVRQMAAHAPGRVMTYGLDAGNEVKAADVVMRGAAGTDFTLWMGDDSYKLHVPVAGRHNVYNALAAAAAASAVGLELSEIAQGLAAFAADRSDMRLQFMDRGDGAQIINDAYNASPVSMRAALDVLAQPTAGRRVAVLGDMLELGPLTREAHTAVGRQAVAAGVDVLIAVGDEASTIVSAAVAAGLDEADAFVCADSREAAHVAAEIVRAHDVVLVKASRGVALETVVDRLLAMHSQSHHPLKGETR